MDQAAAAATAACQQQQEQLRPANVIRRFNSGESD
jgi:hypothetical protein